MHKTNIGQKIALAFAYLGYLAAIVAISIAFIKDFPDNDPMFASLLAIVVFFIGVGIVLHVIGRANLPSFKVTE